MDNRLRAEITEAILRRAATEAHEREMAAIAPEDELARRQTFSVSHEARMRALFRCAKRREIIYKVYANSKRVAVSVLILVVAMFALLLTDYRVQATIRETLIRWYEQFTLFRFQGDEDGYETGEFEWFPAFVPCGFDATDATDFYAGRHIFFENTDGHYIIFEYSPSTDAVIGVDNEYTEMENILYDGIEYFLITPLPDSEHASQVVWRMSGYAFHIISRLDSETLFKMAVSVAPVSP